MLYPIAIEQGDEQQAYGVIVPDIPGCFSAGDTLEEAFQNAKEAIEFHLEGLVEDGEEIPKAKSLEVHKNNPELSGLTLALVEVDITHLLGKSEKINVFLRNLKPTLKMFKVGFLCVSFYTKCFVYYAYYAEYLFFAQRQHSSHALFVCSSSLFICKLFPVFDRLLNTH